MKVRYGDPHAEAELELLCPALARRGWTKTDEDDWDLLWSFRIPPGEAYAVRSPGQRINHFPGSVTLHFKDELAHFLEAAGEHGIHPRTFSLPMQYQAWRTYAASHPDQIWIVKPKRLAGGVGTRVTRDVGSVDPAADVIVQEYIADPLLLAGHPFKHSLRTYALITGLDPLRALVHPMGPVKFTSRPFGLSDGDLADPVVHLTNPGVQRTNNDVPDPVRCITMGDYLVRLRAEGFDGEKLWSEIVDTIRRTLRAHADAMLRVTTHVTSRHDGCFELVGFDFVVDASLHPWLVEANVGPALSVRGERGSSHHEAQRATKAALVEDLAGWLTTGDPGRFVDLNL